MNAFCPPIREGTTSNFEAVAQPLARAIVRDEFFALTVAECAPRRPSRPWVRILRAPPGRAEAVVESCQRLFSRECVVCVPGDRRQPSWSICPRAPGSSRAATDRCNRRNSSYQVVGGTTQSRPANRAGVPPGVEYGTFWRCAWLPCSYAPEDGGWFSRILRGRRDRTARAAGTHHEESLLPWLCGSRNPHRAPDAIRQVRAVFDRSRDATRCCAPRASQSSKRSGAARRPQL